MLSRKDVRRRIRIGDLRRIWLAPVLALACRESAPTATSLGSPTDVRRYVMPSLSERLDQNGFFILHAPPLDGHRITPERAAELAMADVATFEEFNRPYLEAQRGAKIDFGRLTPDPRVYYAESPYEQDVPEGVHPSIRNHGGPYYLVVLRDAGEPVLSVAVSAYATDYRIEHGRLVLPRNHGSDFRVQAVRVGDSAGIPISPEHAARIASQSFGARVAQLPELVLAGNGFVPQYARWRLLVEHPVSIHEAKSGRPRSTDSLFVGLRGELELPSDATERASADARGLSVRDPLTGRTIAQRLRSGHHDAFTRIAP